MLRTPRWPRRSATILAAIALAGAGALAITLTAVPSHAATCNGYVGLTFDDGPSSSTPALLNALKQYGLRATLFNIGQQAASNPAQVRAEAAAGMWVGNHSYTHSHMSSMSQTQMTSELSQTQNAITAGGAPAPKIFRPPYGETNSTLQSAASSIGLRTVTWDIDSQDWNNASTAAIVQANNQLQNGQIILMHEWPANTIAAIPQIAQNLANRGLCPGMISPTTGRAVAPDGTSPTTPPVTTPPRTTPPVTTPPVTTGPPPPSGSCSATYQLVNTWQGGFQANVTVKAGNAAINGWTVRFTLPSGETITQLWNGANSGTSGAVTVKNLSYNGNLPANGSATFGFTGTSSSAATAPSTVACSSP